MIDAGVKRVNAIWLNGAGTQPLEGAMEGETRTLEKDAFTCICKGCLCNSDTHITHCESKWRAVVRGEVLQWSVGCIVVIERNIMPSSLS